MRETGLTIERTDEICRAAKIMTSQIKTMSDNDTAVHSMKVYKSRRPVDSKRDVSSASCSKCGRRHDLRQKESCPSFGKQCHQCRRMDHFAAKCKSAVKERSVRVVDAESDEEVFTLSGVSKIESAQIVTLRLDSGNHLRFQIDSGAQCNVVPMSLYEKATCDYERRLVSPVRTSIVAYGRSKFAAACIGMHLIEYYDNDALNEPETSTVPVYFVNNSNYEGIVNHPIPKCVRRRSWIARWRTSHQPRFDCRRSAACTTPIICSHACTSHMPLKICNTEVLFVDSFTYLGSLIKNDGSSSRDITSRIAKATSAMYRLSNPLFRKHRISIQTKINMYRTLVVSVLLYGSEAWATTLTDRRRLDVFDMRCQRRLLRVFWQQHISGDTSAWGESIFATRCSQWILAREVG